MINTADVLNGVTNRCFTVGLLLKTQSWIIGKKKTNVLKV